MCECIIQPVQPPHIKSKSTFTNRELQAKLSPSSFLNIRDYTIRNENMIGCFCIWYHFSSYFYVISIFDNLNNHSETFLLSKLYNLIILKYMMLRIVFLPVWRHIYCQMIILRGGRYWMPTTCSFGLHYSIVVLAYPMLTHTFYII